MKSKRIVSVAVLVSGVVLAGAAGFYFGRPAREASLPVFTNAQQTQKQVFSCPMHPGVAQDHAGNCPECGMKLVASVQAGEAAGGCAHEGGGCCGTPAPAAMTLPPGHPPVPGMTVATEKQEASY